MERLILRSLSVGAADQALLPTQPLPAAPAGTVDLRVLEMLTARLCHELIGPIAAINNGVELLAEEDSDFAREAGVLIGDSARRAGARLQFYRFAYGFGQAGALAGPAPHELAAGFFAASRIACDYAVNTRTLPLDRQKLACNLLLVGAEALPRGGRLVLSGGPAGPELEAVGDAAGLSPEAFAALTLETPVAALNSRTIQAYFTGILAEALGYRLALRPTVPERLRLNAVALPP